VGSVFLLNLLDPFSNFGRISVNLVKPIYLNLNNFVATTLLNYNIYWLYPVKLGKIDWVFMVYPVLILGLATWLSYTRGRLYCNTVCPVGTFLGFLSKYSLYRISINNEDCNHCGLCEWDCKSNCIDRINRKVDFSRCVNCFNCFRVCSRDAVTYKLSLPKKKKELVLEPAGSTDESKRSFIAGSIVLALGVFGFKPKKVPHALSAKDTVRTKEIIPAQDTTIPENKDFPVAPPGARSIRKFKDTCTACHLCVSACPTHVLQPSLTQYGITGFMQPHMDYHAGFCNFECTLCMDICPAGALLPTSLEDKKL
jgi:ferredoxin